MNFRSREKEAALIDKIVGLASDMRINEKVLKE